MAEAGIKQILEQDRSYKEEKSILERQLKEKFIAEQAELASQIAKRQQQLVELPLNLTENMASERDELKKIAIEEHQVAMAQTVKQAGNNQALVEEKIVSLLSKVN